jgi:hypothetical protein
VSRATLSPITAIPAWELRPQLRINLPPGAVIVEVIITSVYQPQIEQDGMKVSSQTISTAA